MTDWADEKAREIFVRDWDYMKASQVAQALREARIKGEVGGLIEGRRRGLEEAAALVNTEYAKDANASGYGVAVKIRALKEPPE